MYIYIYSPQARDVNSCCIKYISGMSLYPNSKILLIISFKFTLHENY